MINFGIDQSTSLALLAWHIVLPYNIKLEIDKRATQSVNELFCSSVINRDLRIQGW